MWKSRETSADFGTHLAEKDSKMVVLTDSSPSKDELDEKEIHVYPKPEHFDTFAHRETLFHGDGDLGMLSFIRKDRYMKIKYIQSTYIVGEHPVPYTIARMSTLPPISRSLHAKYAGWRIRALHAAIRLAGKEGLKVWLDDEVLYAGLTKKHIQTEIRQACRDIGAQIMQKTPPRRNRAGGLVGGFWVTKPPAEFTKRAD